jgi:hypothetical protein
VLTEAVRNATLPSVRWGALAATGALLVVLVHGPADGGATPPWDLGAHASDPLLGTWDTGRISFDRVTRALSAAGYNEQEISFFQRQYGLRSASSWRFDLTFYRKRGLPTLVRMGWDPAITATPVDGEHNRYRLLPNHRLALTSVDKFRRYREVYSYSISGRRLKLRVVSRTDPTKSRADLRLDKRIMYVMAAAPLRKIG